MRPCPKCGVLSPVGSAVCAACGAALAPAAGHDTVPGAPLGAALPAPGAAGGHLVGTLVDGKYTIERVLGEGGMGVVYLAKAEHTGTEVVLKAIRPEVAHRQDLRERTLSEGRALARIDHPNVVHLNAVVTEHDALWLVMQYVEGESLEQRLAREAARGALLPLAEALLVFRQILAGVEAAHREGIIHRDLKPANILIRAKDGVVKVTDFGIAKGEEDAQAGRGQTKGIIGSLYYMAPEQVHGQRDLDRRVDVYAMGIVLYQMLVGRVPFDSDSTLLLLRMQAEQPVPSVRAARPELPAAIDGVIARACAKDREHRFADCRQFLQAIAGIEDAAPVRTTVDEAVVPPALPAPPRQAAGTISGQAAELPSARPGGGSRWWMASAVAAGAVAAGLGASYALGIWPAGAGHRGSPGATATGGTTAAPPASTGAPAPSLLDSLAGTWRSESGRQLRAVRVGAELEFQVIDPAEFAPYDYRAGEARFVLSALPGDELGVEDRLRPQPPAEHPRIDPKARSTCLAVFTEAGGKPLRARLSGERLSVDFAKIDPDARNFTVSEGRVTSCRGLERLPAARVVSMFQRTRSRDLGPAGNDGSPSRP